MEPKNLESVHCWKCEGHGMMGKMNIAGIKTLQPCRFCKGVGRLRLPRGSKAWKLGKQVSAPGLGKRINWKAMRHA